jgi:hypothetical protein
MARGAHTHLRFVSLAMFLLLVPVGLGLLGVGSLLSFEFSPLRLFGDVVAAFVGSATSGENDAHTRCKKQKFAACVILSRQFRSRRMRDENKQEANKKHKTQRKE